MGAQGPSGMAACPQEAPLLRPSVRHCLTTSSYQLQSDVTVLGRRVGLEMPSEHFQTKEALSSVICMCERH